MVTLITNMSIQQPTYGYMSIQQPTYGYTEYKYEYTAANIWLHWVQI